MTQTLVRNAQQSGWLPKWSYANQHTNVMVGDPAAIMIASAYAFGARDFDTAAALGAMIKGAIQPAAPAQSLLFGNAGYVERAGLAARSDEHTSEHQSLMRISYAVFCLDKKPQYHLLLHISCLLHLN